MAKGTLRVNGVLVASEIHKIVQESGAGGGGGTGVGDEIEVKDAGNYSSISSFTDGKIGIGVTADSNRWSVIMGNRSSHSIIAGFKAQAITN